VSVEINLLAPKDTHNGFAIVRDIFLRELPKYGITITGNVDIDLILNTPAGIKNSKAKTKILYTTLEGDTLPSEWGEYCSLADNVITTSKFVQGVFKKGGVESECIPLGYDESVFVPKEKDADDGVFTFLHYEAFQDRKGWEDLLDAWHISGLAQEEFTARLILKTVKPIKEVYNILKEREIFLPYNVEVMSARLPHRCMPHLLSNADCFVFPSRGEGFGMSPLEALACGTQVILSVGHSHTEYFDHRYMIGVPADIKIPAWKDQGSFVRCNVDKLASALKDVYNNKWVTAGVQSQLDYAASYGYDKCIKKLADYLWQLHDK